jgi:predicted AAA+ superfamily ATPase
MYDRWLADYLKAKLDRPYVHLLFGARQTGKSTLLNQLIPAAALRFNLADPQERSRHLANPGEFAQVCRSLPVSKPGHFVFVDEAQAAPSIFDAVQALYDADKTRWRFVLCGSSARKLRPAGTNLLPGRSLVHHLFPLTLTEHPAKEGTIPHATSPLPFPWRAGEPVKHLFPRWDLLTRLAYGALPGIVTADLPDRPELLKACAFGYLEEKIRREALVKDWGAFVRFLQLAAAESGQILNCANIAQEAGLAQPTVKSHYQLFEDMFVGIRIPACSKSARKNLLSTPKFLLFDLGVRHAAAGLNPSPETVKANPGPIFEQWVGIELWQRRQYLGEGRLYPSSVP